jgi:hypothetical protein
MKETENIVLFVMPGHVVWILQTRLLDSPLTCT